ncbi:hypothetical protein McanMca71_008018 [Microsporum canis]|uniref:Aflatoxin regulatory protein domain-containing protein n=1 Tax=Arthroderma otae (strain ATCC MYA-4605 / CBS 113480) TaxID=554155 RepID=C5FQT5_ARTOC|nr:uncharacterized protein MCYG_05057 [Microsporum canis CBS 113480]EEQ32238.1 predicted protein [Microsporum canis CBS 113480]
MPKLRPVPLDHHWSLIDYFTLSSSQENRVDYWVAQPSLQHHLHPTQNRLPKTGTQVWTLNLGLQSHLLIHLFQSHIQTRGICGLNRAKLPHAMARGSINAMAMIDYFYTSTDDFALPGAEYQSSPGFSLSVPQTTDFDCFPQIPSLSSIGEDDNNTALSPEDLALKQPHGLLNGHSCVRAMKMLQASISGEPTHREHSILSSTPPITTTDQALLACSGVSKQLIEMLECRCEADAYLPFRITVMISKVLATYSAIAKVDDLTPFSFCSISKIQQEQGQGQADFMAAPLWLGAYEVDRELEGTLRAQLVFHELSKFEPVVKLFADKYCQNGDEAPGEDGAIYSALGQFIKHRFDTTKTACELRSPLPTQRI